MNMDTNKINDLAKILRQNQLTKLDLTEGDTRIVLEAGGRQAVVEMPVVSVENIAEVPVAEVPSVEKAEAPAGVEQKSPLVGTVYLAPQAGAEPFVQVGDKVKKGDVLAVARIAGIMGAKNNSMLIPLCHAIAMTKCDVEFELDEKNSSITAICTTACVGKTGVEMEAMTGVSVALLTIYDMCKALDRGMEIGQIHLLEKSGGKSGHYVTVHN